MVFSSTTKKNGLIQDCESLSNLGDGGITNDSVKFAKFTGWINQAYSKVAMAIMVSDKNWRWDDSNWGSDDNQAIPVATCTLVSGQRSYILPRATNTSDYSTLWRVYKVRILDTSGEWYDLVPLASDADETGDGTQVGSGHPTKYRLLRNTIRLNDPPLTAGVTLTQGMQVWFQREFDPFTVADTTQQPGFMSSYHHLLSLDASAKYLLPFNTQLASSYITLFNAGLAELQTSYATRNDDPKTTKQMTPRIESTR